jgi:hypothetical protein
MPTNGQQDSAALIRARLLSGELPTKPPVKVWVGKGTRKPCMGCDQPIPPEAIEYEIDLAGSTADRPVTLRFDEACLAVWRKERARLDAA